MTKRQIIIGSPQWKRRLALLLNRYVEARKRMGACVNLHCTNPAAPDRVKCPSCLDTADRARSQVHQATQSTRHLRSLPQRTSAGRNHNPLRNLPQRQHHQVQLPPTVPSSPPTKGRARTQHQVPADRHLRYLHQATQRPHLGRHKPHRNRMPTLQRQARTLPPLPKAPRLHLRQALQEPPRGLQSLPGQERRYHLRLHPIRTYPRLTQSTLM